MYILEWWNETVYYHKKDSETRQTGSYSHTCSSTERIRTWKNRQTHD